MRTELNVANSLVLNLLAGRSKNNNDIVPGFNKKTTLLASAISRLKQ
ncbi:molybdopterin-binding protein [Salmonella enterica subsp. enterica]|nr:molybdopterin-binding protein [Salmonella enterica subsp. enterica]